MVTGGFGTWFYQNGVAGACGTVHKDTDLVVALPTEAYKNGANCGRKIRVYKAGDNTHVDAVVADECPTCDNNSCVDMSLATFEALAGLPVGEFPSAYTRPAVLDLSDDACYQSRMSSWIDHFRCPCPCPFLSVTLLPGFHVSICAFCRRA